MKLFSQRKGINPIKTVMQIETMDDDLRIGIWNTLSAHYWCMGEFLLTSLFPKLWMDFFKFPIDTLSRDWNDPYNKIRKLYFLFPWNEVYDFIEFIVNNYPDPAQEINPKFISACNAILERELSAYRFVGGRIIQITSDQEISEIEKALELGGSLKPVNIHIKSALDKLSDRKTPDYRNSIKESISAVEAVCKLISNDDKATLDKALDTIEDLHPALKRAFGNLYGYTSDAQGIRHALLDEPSLSFEDAKFMLVSCSAFINYLISKMSKVGRQV